MGRTNETDRDTADRRTPHRDVHSRPLRRQAAGAPPTNADVEGKGLHGRINTIVADRGFGFIDGANGVQYFFHYSVCLPSNRVTFDNLYEGEKVTFDGIKSPKGPRCEAVTSMENASPEEREAAVPGPDPNGNQ